MLNAFKEAKNAIVDFNKIKEVYQLRAKLERSAKGYVDLAQLQYINGVINYMDVLDAQRGYFDAQIGVSNAIRDELIAMVNVYKALGGGWQTEWRVIKEDSKGVYVPKYLMVYTRPCSIIGLFHLGFCI